MRTVKAGLLTLLLLFIALQSNGQEKKENLAGLLEKAEAGDVEYYIVLGDLYHSGQYGDIRVGRDRDKALKWYKKAADENRYYAVASYKYAVCLQEDPEIKYSPAVKKYLLRYYANYFEEWALYGQEYYMDARYRLTEIELYEKYYGKELKDCLESLLPPDHLFLADYSPGWPETVIDSHAKLIGFGSLLNQLGILYFHGFETYRQYFPDYPLTGFIGDRVINKDYRVSAAFLKKSCMLDTTGLGPRFILAEMYALGKGVYQNRDEAMKLLVGVESPFLVNNFILGLADVRSDVFADKGLAAINKSASTGFTKALSYMLMYNSIGLYQRAGIKIDGVSAMLDSLYRTGNPPVVAYSGLLQYNNGRYKEAKHIFDLTENQEPIAKLGLAMMYAEGKGVEKDRGKAKSYLEELIEEKNILASYKYAQLLEEEGDMEGAYRYYDLSTQKYYYEARLQKANMLYEGRGVNRNFDEAAKIYSDLSRAGVYYAKYMLGKFYLFGEGSYKSNKKYAAPLLDKAKEGGIEEAADLIEEHNLTRYLK